MRVYLEGCEYLFRSGAAEVIVVLGHEVWVSMLEEVSMPTIKEEEVFCYWRGKKNL